MKRTLYLSVKGDMRSFIEWCDIYGINSTSCRSYSAHHGHPISYSFWVLLERKGIHFKREEIIEYRKIDNGDYIRSLEEQTEAQNEKKREKRHTFYDAEYFFPVGAGAGRWVVEKGIDYERLNRVLDIGRNVRYKECKRVKQ